MYIGTKNMYIFVINMIVMPYVYGNFGQEKNLMKECLHFKYKTIIHLFFIKQNLKIVFAVGTQELRPEIPKNCPSSYTELIVNCWNSDPLLRPTFKEIVERVQKLE